MVKPEWASKTTRLSMHGLSAFMKLPTSKIFFAVRLDDNDNNAAPGYRTRASQIARQIAVEIINSEKIF